MGLYVQRDALHIAQKALDITGNNISNIDTVGYTRQRVDICSVSYAKNTLYYNTAIPLSGNGSEAVGVTQIRNKIADKKVRSCTANLCQAGVKAETLSSVENIFDSIESDARDTDGKDLGVSFASLVNKLKSSLSSFSVDHADRREMASIAVNSAQSLVQCINSYDIKINDVCDATITDTTAAVNRINTIFSQMANLNDSIKDAYISMGYFTTSFDNYKVMDAYGPLELKDSMNNLLDELSQYGNIEYTEESDGTFTVKFADTIVVKEKYYAQMAMTELNPRPTELGFVLTSNGAADFEPKLDPNGAVIDPYRYINKDMDYRIRGLKTEDEWHMLHDEYGTGGDVQFLIRNEKAGPTLNITGGPDGRSTPKYLERGSLRGLLDVYNGRGVFSDKSGTYATVEQQIKVANDALGILSTAAVGSDEAVKAKADLEKALGANVEIKEMADGTKYYTAKIGEKFILDENGAKTLTLEAKDNEDHAEIQADGETVRTVYSNEQKGIEYYRDLLNAYVKTITEEFNGIFKDFPDVELFTYDTESFRTAAADFRVSDCWIKDPMIIANPAGEGNNEFLELSNEYVNKLLGVFTKAFTYSDTSGNEYPSTYTLENYVSVLCLDLGEQIAHAETLYETADVSLTVAETKRSESMDVSMEDEGINMMNYQKWYNAISRMVTTMDELLDKLINNTGIVGLR